MDRGGFLFYSIFGAYGGIWSRVKGEGRFAEDKGRWGVGATAYPHTPPYHTPLFHIPNPLQIRHGLGFVAICGGGKHPMDKVPRVCSIVCHGLDDKTWMIFFGWNISPYSSLMFGVVDVPD
ncbi:MAG: hypothetical protein DRG39_04065 [Deltaproteobacteria bacterium]|nr:MAG: hypothetical protein DRG39_04065 [Deltaproteobacteria bacterium]